MSQSSSRLMRGDGVWAQQALCHVPEPSVNDPSAHHGSSHQQKSSGCSQRDGSGDGEVSSQLSPGEAPGQIYCSYIYIYIAESFLDHFQAGLCPQEHPLLKPAFLAVFHILFKHVWY